MLEIIKRKKGLKSIRLAFDVVEEPYYGKLDSPYMFSRTSKGAKGSTGSFKYLSVSSVVEYCSIG